MKSKRYKKLPEKTKEQQAELFDKVLSKVKLNCTTKFDESVDLSFQINNKQKKSEINIRTVINLPGGTGKKIKIAVVCEEAKIKELLHQWSELGTDEFLLNPVFDLEKHAEQLAKLTGLI